MSIFDKRAGWDPGPWLREKTLASLREVAKLVDVANEADTTPWYARRLRRAASALVGRLAPVTLLVHGANQKALEGGEWNAIAEHGTLALAAWCERWGIADAKFISLGEDLDDGDDKDLAPEDHPEVDDDLTRTLDRRLELMGLLCRRMLNEALSEPARRLLVFLMGHLGHSRHSDIVLVSRRFLPGDAGLSPEDTSAAYRALYEQGFVERVDALTEGQTDALALRLLVDDFNDRKHRTPFRQETFGFPGARVAGKPTLGNVFLLPVSPFVERAIAGWPALGDDERASLVRSLQEVAGKDRAYIEEAKIVSDDGAVSVEVKLRLPMEDSDDELRLLLAPAADAWLRRHLGGVGQGGAGAAS
jgi:hypothetical protein